MISTTSSSGGEEMLVFYLEYKVPYATTPQYYNSQLLCNVVFFFLTKSLGMIDGQPVIPLIGLLQENQQFFLFFFLPFQNRLINPITV